MFSKIIIALALLKHRIRNFLVRNYFVQPFVPFDPDWYVDIASTPVKQTLADDRIEQFHQDIDAFMTGWGLTHSGMNIVQAMSLYSNDDYECKKLYYPMNKEEREQIRYSRLFEVILRKNTIYVALFVAGTNIPAHYEEYQPVTVPDLNRDCRVRYVDDFTGLIYRVLPETSNFVYNPERPIVVYKLVLPEGDPLLEWCNESADSTPS